MKQKGFTLVELLAVLAILAILALLITPTVFTSIEKFKKEASEKQIVMLETAASNWASDKLKNFAKGTYYITIGDLKAEGYLEKNFKNPMTNKNYPNDANIKIEYTGKTYKVSYIKYSGTTSIESNLDNNGPRLKLTGNSIITLSLGKTFTDEGAIAYSSSGSNISSSITKTIKKNNSTVVSSVDTSSPATYVIYYKVTNSGVTHVITRNVLVHNTSPVKTLSGNVNVDAGNGIKVNIKYTVTKNQSLNKAYLDYYIYSATGYYNSYLGNNFIIYLHARDSKTGVDSGTVNYYMMLEQMTNDYGVYGVNGNASGKVEVPYSNTYYDGLILYSCINSEPETSRIINISWNEADLQ